MMVLPWLILMIEQLTAPFIIYTKEFLFVLWYTEALINLIFIGKSPWFTEIIVDAIYKITLY